jgi:hypothetical protein
MRMAEGVSFALRWAGEAMGHIRVNDDAIAPLNICNQNICNQNIYNYVKLRPNAPRSSY